MPKITDKQKQKFYKLYKQGFGQKIISREVGIAKTYVSGILRSFNAGDFSWLEHSFRHRSKFITEEEKVMIVKELLKTPISWAEAVQNMVFQKMH
ncbi:MAG: hypothetical protein K5634_04310 [Sphaerochaetaceae bacterium]|nr:hypothetical protein [Sphaerochaetaceae bacterium]